MNRYIREVIEAHVAIERWLGQGEGDLSALLGRFSHDYSMITPGGGRLDYAALSTLFGSQRGGRRGLQIEVDQCVVLQEGPDGATVLYRERQTLPEKGSSLRWSTAVFTLENAEPRWRHLHETTLP